MRRSVLLRRIILLLLSAVMLSGILSAGIYIFVTRRMYADLRAKELAPIARTVSALLTDARESGGYGRGALLLLDQGNKNFLGASLNIYNAQGGSLMNPPGDIPRGGKSGVPPEDFDREAINAADLAAILAGGEVSGIRKSSDGRSYLLV
ncbi:MAG: hypothetical protein LBT36_03555, partial [Oscillospiraceae bacterium]|nr:hypothetical protein [Oscillospiraceae bacterium]